MLEEEQGEAGVTGVSDSEVRRLGRRERGGWSRTAPRGTPYSRPSGGLTSRKSKAQRLIISVSAACVPTAQAGPWDTLTAVRGS